MTIFQKFFVSSYRFTAIAILSFVLLAAASYFATVIIFSLNTSWSAPVIISKSNPRIVTITGEVFRANQAIDALDVEIVMLKGEEEGFKQMETTLVDLVGRYDQALIAQQKQDRNLSGRLSSLTSAKRGVDRMAANAVASTSILEKSIDQELKAGLITAEAAARSRSQVVAAHSTLNAGLISTAALDYQVSELTGSLATMGGGAQSPKALETVARVAELKRDLTEVKLKQQKTALELVNKVREVAALRTFIATLEHSPYYQVAMGDVAEHTFAFVPYENEASAQVGTDVYSCFAKVIFCSKVGTIKSVSKDEEKGRHPVFQRDVRGFLVDMQLEAGKGAKDQVLFFGSAPLLF